MNKIRYAVAGNGWRAMFFVRAALNLPENLVPSLVLALGKPDEKIIMTELEQGGNSRYYRDENGQHYVPKRKLEDITLG